MLFNWRDQGSPSMGIGISDGAASARCLDTIKGTGAGPMGRAMRHEIHTCMYLRTSTRTVPVTSLRVPSGPYGHIHRSWLPGQITAGPGPQGGAHPIAQHLHMHGWIAIARSPSCSKGLGLWRRPFGAAALCASPQALWSFQVVLCPPLPPPQGPKGLNSHRKGAIAQY